MKNILLILIILTFFSCNQLTNDVENSFSAIEIKLDSLNNVEKVKIEKLFNEINSRQIKKYDGENSALIYHSVIEHNRTVDSLIIRFETFSKTNLENKKLIKRFEDVKADLKNKLNTVSELNIKTEIDSMLKPSGDLDNLSKFAIISILQEGKLNASKSAGLLLNELNKKGKE